MKFKNSMQDKTHQYDILSKIMLKVLLKCTKFGNNNIRTSQWPEEYV